jgi:recombination protein RecR
MGNRPLAKRKKPPRFATVRLEIQGDRHCEPGWLCCGDSPIQTGKVNGRHGKLTFPAAPASRPCAAGRPGSIIQPMSSYAQSIQDLIDELGRLPGIGPRSAERIAFHLLKQSPAEALRLAEAIRQVKTRIKHCAICSNLTEEDPCRICSDASRDQSLVCVVEQPKDLLALEATGLYRGVYHVLLGRIAPLDEIHPQDLTIEPLMKRLAEGKIRELIMGTNPTVEGDGTALYIQNLVQERFAQVRVTRLARGLPTGGSIEYANKSILSDAIRGRQSIG